jgi:hypothetical protein
VRREQDVCSIACTIDTIAKTRYPCNSSAVLKEP